MARKPARGGRHLDNFVRADNFGRRLKTLKGLIPYEFICTTWTSQPERFTLNPLQKMPGPNTEWLPIQSPQDPHFWLAVLEGEHDLPVIASNEARPARLKGQSEHNLRKSALDSARIQEAKSEADETDVLAGPEATDRLSLASPAKAGSA